MCYPHKQNSSEKAGDGLVYESGFHRFKHCGQASKATIPFDQKFKMFVGKCPNTMTLEIAQKLLVDGLHERLKRLPKTPTIAIWNVHEGVVYKAVPNNVGDGWHGYPTCEKSETGGVPKAIRRQLLNRAGEKMQRETKNWLQQRLIR